MRRATSLLGLALAGALSLSACTSEESAPATQTLTAATLASTSPATVPPTVSVTASAAATVERVSTPSPTSTSEATPLATVIEPAAAVSATPTGVDAVDAVVRALEEGDVESLLALVEYQQIECIWPPDGLGPAPLCEEGEPPGTVAAFFLGAQCEGYLTRDARGLIEAVSTISGSITVRELPKASQGALGWPRAEYMIEVGGSPQQQPARLSIAKGHIVSVTLGC